MEGLVNPQEFWEPLKRGVNWKPPINLEPFNKGPDWQPNFIWRRGILFLGSPGVKLGTVLDFP